MTSASVSVDTSPSRWLAATGWLTLGHAGAVGFRLLALVAVARTVGVEQIGVIVVGLSLASGMAMTFSGTQTAGIIEASRHPGSRREIRAVAVRQQLLIAAVVYSVFALVIVFVAADYRTVLLVFGLSAFTQAVTLRWLLVAGGEARFAAVAFVGGALVFLAGCLVVVDEHSGLWRVAVLHVGVELAIAAVLWRRDARIAPGPSSAPIAPSLPGLALGRTLRLSVLQLARIAPITVSVVVVALVLGDVDAGRYALVQRAAVAAFALTALHTEAGTAPLVGWQGSIDRLSRTTVPIAAGAIGIAIVAGVLADPVAEVILDDDSYRGMGVAVALLVLALGVAFLSGPRLQVGFAAGRDRPLLVASVGAAGATVAGAALLSAIIGLEGVALAELLGQLAFLALVVTIGRRS